MAKYNTFLVLETKGVPLLVTSSARKARKLLQTGVRVEVWSANSKVETIYHRTIHLMGKYVTAEREYIRARQAAAEKKNRQRARRSWKE